MWIVQLALRRPYTFVVMALCIVVLGVLAMVRMPADIFPDINIPVVSVVWNYNGFSPSDMADRIVTNSERGFTVTVNDNGSGNGNASQRQPRWRWRVEAWERAIVYMRSRR